MTNTLVRVVLIATVAVAGCATQTQMLDKKQNMALQTALTRAKFDMNCPTANAEVLSGRLPSPPCKAL